VGNSLTNLNCLVAGCISYVEAIEERFTSDVFDFTSGDVAIFWLGPVWFGVDEEA
jgi:hypothetical protein